jgi:hypothetical protein
VRVGVEVNETEAVISHQEQLARACVRDGYAAGLAEGYRAGVEAAAELLALDALTEPRACEALRKNAGRLRVSVRCLNVKALEAKARRAVAAFPEVAS